MISGGSSDSKTQPWEGQADFLRSLYNRAESQWGGTPYEYGPDRVAEFDPASNRAFNMVEQRATQGSSLNRAAQGHAEDTIRGDYLDPDSNPWLERTGEVGARALRRNYLSTVQGLGSRMEASGRTGSGAHATGSNINDENLATGLGDFYSKLYGGAYDQERNRQMGATGMAGQLSELDYRDATALRNVGMQREGRQQSVLDELVARFNFNQYEPQKRLQEFAGNIGSPVMESEASSMNFGIL